VIRKKRVIYDETGIVDGEEMLFSKKTGKEWEEYWKLFFKKFTTEDIEAFENGYKNSKDEEQDIINTYKKLKGDITHILDYIIGSEEEDLSRYIQIIQNHIDAGDITKYSAFQKSCEDLKKTKKKREIAREKEKKSATRLATKKLDKNKGQDEDSLKYAIVNKKAKNAENMEDLVAKIQSKYTKQHSETSKGLEEPSEEEFQEARRRIEEKKQSTTKQGKRKRT